MVAARRARGAGRARRAALRHHVLPDHPRPDRAAPRPAEPARAVHAAGPGPHRRHHRTARAPAARPDQRADRHRHRVHRRRRPPRPRRAAGRPGPGPARGSCCTRGQPSLPRTPPADRPVLEFDPAWVRFAPLTSAGLVIAAGVLGVASQVLNTVRRLRAGSTPSGSPTTPGPGRSGSRSRSPCWRWRCWSRRSSIAGYVVTNWGFRLTHAAGALAPAPRPAHDPRDDARRRAGARRVGRRAARAAPRGRRPRHRDRRPGSGRGESGSSLLVPPAPRDVVHRVAGAVLRSPGPLDAPLTGHGPRARTRRFTRALGPAAGPAARRRPGRAARPDAPVWLPVVAALGVPLALALAADRVPRARPRARRRVRRGALRQPQPAPRGPRDRRRDRLEPARHVVPAPRRADHPGRHHRRRPAGGDRARRAGGGRGRARSRRAPGPGGPVPRLARDERPRSGARLAHRVCACSPRCWWRTAARSRSGRSGPRTSSARARSRSSPTRTAGPSTGSRPTRPTRSASAATRCGPTSTPRAIVAVALRAGADAVYPGYGFLSENPGLAEACANAGITFVGPTAEVLTLTGNKARAIAAAKAAGVPTLASVAPVDRRRRADRGRERDALPAVREGRRRRRWPRHAPGRRPRRTCARPSRPACARPRAPSATRRCSSSRRWSTRGTSRCRSSPTARAT